MQRLLVLLIVCFAIWPKVGDAKVYHYITCEMVRSYVARVGVAHAKAEGLAYGMTTSQERRARRCLHD